MPETPSPECQLNAEPFRQCCCTCIHRKPVFHHCTTRPKPMKWVDGCVCSVQKGWACQPPLGEGAVYDNWPEHSVGCEMHAPETG